MMLRVFKVIAFIMLAVLSPFGGWARLAHIGPYAGLSLGWSFMSANRTFAWTNSGPYSHRFLENAPQSTSGFDNNLFLGWRFICWPLLWGVEGNIGSGCQKMEYHHKGPFSADCFVVSDMSEQWHGGIYGLAGYDLDGWGLFAKLGVSGSRVRHFYQEQDPGRTLYDPPVFQFSPALGIGFLVEKAVTSQLALRLDYTCAFHRPVHEHFRDKRDDGDIVQNLDRFRNQSIMLSVCWYPFKQRRYCLFGRSL